jgi:hypothetical protein
MRNIEIMLNDGMLGPKASLLALSALTTGNLNSKIKKEATPYKMADVLPSTHEYIVPPLTPEEAAQQAQRALVAFAQSKPGSPDKLNRMAGNG